MNTKIYAYLDLAKVHDEAILRRLVDKVVDLLGRHVVAEGEMAVVLVGVGGTSGPLGAGRRLWHDGNLEVEIGSNQNLH